VGLSAAFTPLQLDGRLSIPATPIRYGRIEPPGRLPSCARLPRLESHPRAAAGFPQSLDWFPPTVHSPFSSRTRLGLCRSSRGRQLHGLLGLQATPAHFGWTEPPGRLPPAPGSQRSSRIPGRRPVSPRVAAPPDRSFHLTVPGLAWASSVFTATEVLRLLRCAATPVHYGRTEPPGRLPSCARLPTSQAPKLAGLLTRQRPAPFSLRLSGLSWASPRC
jgi:hypothetical protein